MKPGALMPNLGLTRRAVQGAGRLPPEPEVGRRPWRLTRHSCRRASRRRPATSARPSASWLTTVDHKRIGILYGVTAFVFFLIGGHRGADHPPAARPARTTRS